VADRIISDDGKWMWTGSEWIPNPPDIRNVKIPPQISDDGKWMWTGSEWIPNVLDKEEDTDNNWWHDSEFDSSDSNNTNEEKTAPSVQDTAIEGIAKMPEEHIPQKSNLQLRPNEFSGVEDLYERCDLCHESLVVEYGIFKCKKCNYFIDTGGRKRPLGFGGEKGTANPRKFNAPTSRIHREGGVEPTSSVVLVTGFFSFVLIVVFLVLGASTFSTIFASDEFGTTTPSSHRVSYYVHAESQSVDITISNSGGGTSQFSNVPMWDENGDATPWTYDFTAYFDGFTFLYVSAQVNQDCECKIQAMIYVDGVRTQFSQSEGAYVIATASEMR